ncbi:MAG: hypothetical protein ITG02_09660 [Patulibacter sp.]|nr:hypothetical protein [Patulibacter sp.]
MYATHRSRPARSRSARLRSSALALAVLALAASSASPAAAMTPPAPEPQPSPRIAVERQGYDLGAQPRFYARLAPIGSEAEVSWRICAPDCGGVVATGRNFQPPALPVGGTVQAVAVLDGEYVGAQSVPWWGPPTAIGPPGITGDLRTGQTIGPAPGRWVGGWADDGSSFTYRLCRTASGDDCRALRPATGSGDRIVIDPAWGGWYLGAIEHRYGWGTAFPAVAYAAPAWGVLPDPRAAVIVGPLGVAGPLAGPIPDARPGSRPRVRGTLAAGRTVRIQAGAWPDSPDAGTVWSGLQACPKRTVDDRCVPLTDFARMPGSPAIQGRRELPALDQPVRLDQRYLGWYVGAVDLRIRDAAERGGMSIPPLRSLTEFAIPAPSPVVVHGALSRKPVRLGFTPRATIRSRATTHATRRTTLATVRCKDRCVARATIVSGGRTTRVRMVVRKNTAKRLTVPARGTRGQRARVVIRFDDHPRTARKTVRLVSP